MRQIAILVGAALSLAAHNAATAADLPPSAPPPPVVTPVAYNWSGFYLGGNVGGAWGAGCKNATFIGGGQAGYNMQFGAFVAGLEADIAGVANHSKTNTVAFGGIAGLPGGTYTFDGTREPNVVGTVRARLGFAVDRALFFITGGLAYGSGTKDLVVNHFGPAGNLNGTWSASSSKSPVGWTIGAGIEYAVANNWTIKGEYLFLADLSDNNSSTVVCSGPCAGVNPALTWVSSQLPTALNIARLGLNYKF
jgi:outer membrane immunogenic protein